LVLGVVAPVVDVDVGQARDEQLELLLVKDLDKALGDDFVEGLEESVDLLADDRRQLVLGDELDVFELVCLREEKKQT